MVAPAETRDEVMQRLRAVQEHLLNLGVRRLALFGSFVRQEADAHSDVDVLVEFDPHKKTYDAFLAVCDLLEHVLARPVDVVTPEALSPHIGPHILAEAQDVVRAA